MKDSAYYQEIQDEKNIKDKTLESYKSALKRYTTFNQMSLNELLLEAEHEQVSIHWMRHRKIRKRLKGFQKYLQEEGLQNSSINITLTRVKSFYRMYELDLPQIKLLTVLNTETIHDIPTLDDIRLMVNNTGNLKHKALILFMVSSGTGTKETISLTIQDFIIATKDYHNQTDIKLVLKELEPHNDIIPTWTFRREKTNYQYYTFSSPESTTAIILFLNKRKTLKPSDSLFDLTQSGVRHIFERDNKKYGFGKKRGDRNFIHAHALRKTFATTLTKARMDHLIIEWLLGHSIPSTTSSYFKSDPYHLKSEYKKVVNKLSIKEVIIQDKTPAQIKEIVRENADKEERISSLERTVEELVAANEVKSIIKKD